MGELDLTEFLGIDFDSVLEVGLWVFIVLLVFICIIYRCLKKVRKTEVSMEVEVPKLGQPITKITDVWTLQETYPCAKIL